MLLGIIIDALEITSLVPGTWRFSASVVLQSTAIAALVCFIYRVTRLVNYVRWVNKVYGDLPGPKERHWFFGSFYYVRHVCVFESRLVPQSTDTQSLAQDTP